MIKRNKAIWGQCCHNLLWKNAGNHVSINAMEKLCWGFGENCWYGFNISKGTKRWY